MKNRLNLAGILCTSFLLSFSFYKDVSAAEVTEHVCTGTEVITPATENTDGSIEKICTQCNEVLSTKVIPSIKSVQASQLIYNGNTQKTTITVKDRNNNKINSSNYSLSNISKKSVGVYTATVKFKGNYSGTLSVEYSVVPKEPKNLQIIRYQYGNQVKLTWNKSIGATGYRISVKKPGNSDYTYLGSTTKLSYIKGSLTANKKYTFKVTPYYKKNNSSKPYYGTKDAAYSTKEITTVAKGKKVFTVSKPTVTTSHDQAKVSWKKASNATRYQVSQSKKQDDIVIANEYETIKTTNYKAYVIQGQRYYYKVRAYRLVDGKRVYGNWSEAKSYTVNVVNPLALLSTEPVNITVSAELGKGADYFTPNYKNDFKMTAKSSNTKVATVNVYNEQSWDDNSYFKSFMVTQKGYGSTNISLTATKNGKTYKKTVKYIYHKYKNPFSSFKIGSTNLTNKLNSKYEFNLTKSKTSGKITYKLKDGYKVSSIWAGDKKIKSGDTLPKDATCILMSIYNTKLDSYTGIWINLK